MALSMNCFLAQAKAW